VEIEPKKPAGYFNRFVERNEKLFGSLKRPEQGIGLWKPVRSIQQPIVPQENSRDLPPPRAIQRFALQVGSTRLN
jgi:hypothetical protein